MKNLKRTRNKKMTDAEVELFCQSVEDVLTQIKERSESTKTKKSRSKKKKANPPIYDDDVSPSEEELFASRN